MAKLRHIAITVPDPEKAAQFYEKAFGLKRVGLRLYFLLYKISCVSNQFLSNL